MLNKIIMLFVFVFSTLTYALDINTVVPISGSSDPAGTLYVSINEKYDLVLGLSSIVPASTGTELDVDLKIGINAPMPFIDRCDMYLVFDNHSGQVIEGGYDSEFYLQSFRVSKRWMYSLTSDIDFGLSLTLLEVWLEDVNEVHLLSEFNPVVGMTINF